MCMMNVDIWVCKCTEMHTHNFDLMQICLEIIDLE